MSHSPDTTLSEDAAARVLRRCAELARISDEPGRITRGFLSTAMEEADARVASWMERAGMHAQLDVTGNLIGTYPSPREDAPLLVLGSHLDTVRDAGPYDGVLGVLLALASVEELDGASLPFDIEVVAFADEEGLRYGVPFLGSQALIGELDPAFLERRDEDGVTMADAIRSWGGDPGEIRCRYEGRRLIGYLEAHIEQGPWLEHRDLPLGALEAISGACWLRLSFSGRAGHAGTTPMELRRDPLPAAAEVVLAAERLAREEPSLVATVGKLKPRPGASNVIAGSVELSLDVRHPDSQVLASAVDRLLDRCRAIADERRLRFEHEVLHRQDGVEADPQLSQILNEAMAASGLTAERLVIGAGHDALIMARRMPMAMLLLRSPGGISHHPDEAVLPGDVEAALTVLTTFLQRLARDEASRDWELASELGWPETVGATGEAAWDGG